jgi:hypothetical protein
MALGGRPSCIDISGELIKGFKAGECVRFD